MGVRFIIGRAGTGKTRYCVEGVARALAEEGPLGPGLWWIVPDQATFQAERLLLAHPGVGGTFRARVASFRRLTHLLAMELGLPERQDLDDLARVILLGDLVQQHRGELALFGPIADRPGFIRNLDAMLRELQQSAHTGASLREVAGKLEGGKEGGDDPVLPGKLRDLALLLDMWDTEATRRGFASERLAQTVASRMGSLASLRGARVWVDGFSAFHVLEMGLLLGLAEHTAGVEIALTADPLTAAIRDPHGAALDDMSLFHRTERTHQTLRRLFERQGVAVARHVALTTQHRLAGSRALAVVERGLFAGTPRAGQEPTSAAGVVELWECADPLTEVRAAAQAIKRWMAEGAEGGPLRYRDIGLIIPTLEYYADPIRRIFQQHGIPHFIDQRRPIAHHPLIEFLRTAVGLVQRHFASEDWCLLLKTGLTGVTDAEGHRLENYLLAHGIGHHDLGRPFAFIAPNHTEDDPDRPATEAQREQLAAVNLTREALRGRLGKWMKTAGAPATGDVLTRALYELLEACGAPAALERLIEAARAGGDNELLLIHEQAWRRTVELLQALERLLAGRATTLEEFGGILGMALESLTLGLIPPTVDQVLVSSVTRSRHPELKVVMVLGAMETHFPLVRPEDPLLNDRQRELFNAHTDGAIEPGSDRQLIEAQYYDYLAFTRASGRLIVSYPLADERGKAIVRSQYVARLQMLFPELETRRVTPEGLGALDQAATLDDALAATLGWARAGAAAELPEAALYQWLAGSGDAEVRRAAAQVWPALTPRRAPALRPELAGAFYPADILLSVSQLEKYAACPLQYFLYYTLGMRERPRMELDGLQLGTLYHQILERVFERVIAGALPWPECEAGALGRALEEAVGAAAAALHPELAGNVPAYGKMLERTRRTLGVVLEAQRRAACVGDLRPVATELVFGGGRKVGRSLPVLALATGHGRTARLTGKIDRVDAALDSPVAVVVDYKSANEKRLGLHEVYEGLALQLPVYLLVLGEASRALRATGLTPAGAFFVPLGLARRTADDLTELVEPDSEEFYRQVKPRGLIDASAIEHLDHTLDVIAKPSSEWYAYVRNKGKAGTKKNPVPTPGPLAKRNNDALEHADFELVLAYTRHKVAELVDALGEGRIAPAPYRDGGKMPCTYCAFTSMCPFDRVRGACRAVARMKPEEVLGAMRAALGRKPTAAGGDDV